jgi:hypothetical protein
VLYEPSKLCYIKLKNLCLETLYWSLKTSSRIFRLGSYMIHSIYTSCNKWNMGAYRIWLSHSGGYRGYGLLDCNTVVQRMLDVSEEQHDMFLRHIGSFPKCTALQLLKTILFLLVVCNFNQDKYSSWSGENDLMFRWIYLSFRGDSRFLLKRNKW